MKIKLSKRKLRRILLIILGIVCGFQLTKLIKDLYNLHTEMYDNKEPSIDVPTEREDYEVNHVETVINHRVLDTRNKYIYLVTSKAPRKYPFSMFGVGNSIFNENACDDINCYFIDDKTEINEATFDMVAFNAADLLDVDIPENRSVKQKYAFFSYESPQNYPVCVDIYDDFFNWTFTYKLNSDFRWWFFNIYDMNDTIIGPPVDVWPVFEPIGDELKIKLDGKTKMAAWFVSTCETQSGREWVVKELDKELQERYGWSIDVYGSCGQYACPRRYADLCNRLVEERYFFYMALEDSFSEDYITEKILIGLNNFAIPVVYGAVNYSRFLPPGSYLDAKELGTKELARMMNKIATHRDILYDSFKWTNHISYRHVAQSKQICGLCSVLNDKMEMRKTTMYPEFRNWWNNEGWDGSCSLGRDYF